MRDRDEHGARRPLAHYAYATSALGATPKVAFTAGMGGFAGLAWAVALVELPCGLRLALRARRMGLLSKAS